MSGGLKVQIQITPHFGWKRKWTPEFFLFLSYSEAAILPWFSNRLGKTKLLKHLNQLSSGYYLQLKKNKKSKKSPSSEALKLSIHKNTPHAYWSDNLKIAHGSTILAKSQMGSLSSTSQAIPAKMVKHHLNDHIVLLYGLYIGLTSALLLLFAFSIVAYYLPGRDNVQVWNLHFFICENNSHLVSNNDWNHAIRAHMAGSGKAWTQERMNP